MDKGFYIPHYNACRSESYEPQLLTIWILRHDTEGKSKYHKIKQIQCYMISKNSITHESSNRQLYKHLPWH